MTQEPIVQVFTLAANLSEHKDSLIEMGFKFTIIKVFEDGLPRQFCNMNVSFELRQGTCLLSLSAEMTSANALKLLLIASVSFCLSPSTLVVLSRSEPAKSMRFNVLLSTFIQKIRWLLDERSLHIVSATTRLFSAFLSS